MWADATVRLARTRHSFENQNLVDEIEFVKAGVVDSELPTDVDVVYHLAALSSYTMHEDNPQKGARVNVEGVRQRCRAGSDGWL